MLDTSNPSPTSLALGALSITTALAALSKTGRQALLQLPATAYVHLFHDPLPKDEGPDQPQSCSTTSSTQPISILAKHDARPAYVSHSALATVFKAVFGKSEGEKLAQAGLRAGAEKTEGIPWVRICDFAAEADPEQWITEDELNSWRRQSDTPADRALAALRRAQELVPDFQPRSPADPIADISELAKLSADAELDDARASLRADLQAFLTEINQRPPRGAGAISEEWYSARDARRLARGVEPHAPLTHEELIEELTEEARILRAAQQMFYKFVGPILLSLLHFSLAGGFSSPKIMSVLRQTGYLVPYRNVSSSSGGEDGASKTSGGAPKRISPVERAAMQSQRTADRTWSRLLETTQYVLDVMQDVDALLPPALFANPAIRTGCYPQPDPRGRKHMGSTPDSHSFHAIGDAQRSYLERVGGGRGWQSSVRVRLLHANVRAKIQHSVQARQARSATMFDADADADGDKKTKEAAAAFANLYDEERNGVPINQEDLLATLASFSTSPLWCMGRMGHHVNPQEREDFVALWRHVGFYMGCEPALLRRCFGNARKADGFLFNVVGHLFPNISQHVGPADGDGKGVEVKDGAAAAGSEVSKEVEAAAQEHDTLASLAILQACADRPPFHTSLQTHWALSRHLLGPSLANYLGIPRTAPLQQVSVDLSFLATRIPILFGSFPFYPRALRARWECERLRLGRIMMRRLICWLYGAKLATFAGRSVGASGEVKVELDPKDGAAYARAWRMLMMEMVGVLVGCGLLGAVLVAGVAAAVLPRF
ncbi:hypothetical protein OC844_004926 [Tilletia horrida]|nr:hypothetical protein OC844_004926 [Tilletia horrida]